MDESRPNVLLVDDVEANLVALEALLEGMGCELVRAGSGNEALRQLLKREFAVMLLDVQMPGMDGFEVARYARENPATRDVPIIFLTAMQGTEDNVLRGYGSGAVDFLLKPINPHVLRAKVRVFLDLRQQQQRLSSEIEAHKRTLAELRVVNDALRHFTSAASHDLKEPLRAIQGFLQMLIEDKADGMDEQAREYIERTRKASQRMVSLLDSLLAYARLQRPVTWTEINCDLLLEQVRMDLAPRAADAKATITVGPLPIVKGDEARLYQLFLNLVGNGIKFHRPGVPPQIDVTARMKDGELVFSVQDNGIGIEAKHQGEVFEAFRRLHARTEYEGSGLGLTICRQIVEQHGGRLWLESKPGEGSRFFFTLPGTPRSEGQPPGG